MEEFFKKNFFCYMCKQFLNLEKKIKCRNSCVECRKKIQHNYYLKKRKETINCKCGLKVKSYSFNRHIKSMYHKDRLIVIEKIKKITTKKSFNK